MYKIQGNIFYNEFENLMFVFVIINITWSDSNKSINELIRIITY